MRRLLPPTLVAAACLAAACASTGRSDPPGLALPEGWQRAESRIDAPSLRATVAEIGGDAYEGRGTASAGEAKARAWLIARLKAAGLKPGAPGGAWEQPVPLVGVTAAMPKAWTFMGPSGERAFRWWSDYIAASGAQVPEVSVENAEVVFVGYGIAAPEESWDDFKGEDVSGKILLFLNDDPDWDPKLFAGPRRLYYGRWTYKYEVAAARGAAGAIIVHTDASAGYPWKVVQTSWSGEQFELPADPGAPRLRIKGWLALDAARALAALGGHELGDLVARARTREFRPVPLGVTTSIRFANTVHTTESANVIARLEGRDPKLKDEAVVLTAHVDHLGIGEPDAGGDRVYNGAVDNATGVAQVLAAAEAAAALPSPPRRSLLFAFVTAEEQGLLGSAWLAAHPPFPAGRLAGTINLDGANIFGRTKDVAIIGRGKSSLEDLLEKAAARQGRTVGDDPFPEKGSYYRSDQFSLAKIGVPALYFRSGTSYVGRPADWGRRQVEEWIAARYHQPSDELTADWSLDGMVDDARLAYVVALAAAEDERLPSWRPGDEFESVRRKALSDVGAGAR